MRNTLEHEQALQRTEERTDSQLHTARVCPYTKTSCEGIQTTMLTALATTKRTACPSISGTKENDS